MRMSNPKDKKGFNLQRKKGTAGGEKLTEEEQNAKEEVDSYLSECSSYTEVRERLRKMPTTEETDAQHTNKESEDSKEGEETISSAEMKKFMQFVYREMSTLKEKVDKGDNPKTDPPTSKDVASNLFEDVLDDKDANWVTSDEEDEKIIGDDPGRVLERIRRRKRRELAKAMEAEKKLNPALRTTTKEVLPKKTTKPQSKDDFEKAQIAVAKVTDDEFVQHLMERAKTSWMENPDYWGPAPFTGYGDDFRAGKQEPPILKHDATGPQFDQWFKDWRLYITAASGGVHPLAMNAFLIDHVEKSCTVETWQWVNQNHKDEDAAAILKALKSRVFSRTNMAGTFLDILQKRQTPQQELSALIAENDAMIVHFERAYVHIYPHQGSSNARQTLLRHLQNCH